MMNNLFINGQWLQGLGAEFYSRNPVDQHVVWEGKSATDNQVSAAVEAAKKAQVHWAFTSISHRIKHVERFTRLLEQNHDELAGVISAETGKPAWEAKAEVSAMVNKVAISIQAQQQRAGDFHNGQLHLHHRPHGVMAVYGPYNFPGHLPNGHIVPALLAGNSIVFKPSEETPWTAQKTMELWEKAGLPRGLMNLVQGGREVGEALSHAHIEGVLFTGSSRVGQLLHRQFAGRPDILLALEMGGNNPLIIDSGVSVSAAANIIINSAYVSAGQRCTCARRLILIESEQTDAVLQTLTSLIDRIIVDSPNASPEPFMGPVINETAAHQLLLAEQSLIDNGARLIRSMVPNTESSALLRPGLVDVTDIQQVEDKEWFGPLLQLYRVSTFEEAIFLANNTRFGLAAGLVSDSPERQSQFLTSIKAGVVSINAPTAGASSALPFGGIGASGNHRPSAFYAADYCAWPQAQTLGQPTSTQLDFNSRGLRP